MNTLTIIDFNRTLFDPEKGALYDDAITALQTLRKAPQNILVLVSRNEPGRRENIRKLGIAEYFSAIYFVPKKTETLFRSVIEKHNSAPVHTYVVGDHMHEEIRVGNTVGAHTVWLRRGAFSNLQKLTPYDVPKYTIHTLTDVQRILAL